MGDGNLVRLRDGKVLCVFRHNHAPKDYAVEIKLYGALRLADGCNLGRVIGVRQCLLR